MNRSIGKPVNQNISVIFYMSLSGVCLTCLPRQITASKWPLNEINTLTTYTNALRAGTSWLALL